MEVNLNIFHYVYCLPLPIVLLIMIIAVTIWTIISLHINQKYWRYINILCFILSFFVIIYATVFNRTPGTTNDLILTPLYSLVEAKEQTEMYRTMLMNCFLFLPLGLSMPYALPQKIKFNAVITIVLAIILSVCVEFLQYKFALGRAETDDVLCNTFGAVTGTVSFLILIIFKRRINIEKAQ